MRILVIGGTSFIGPAVVSRLSAQGHDITIFHRGQTEADLPSTIRHIHAGEGQLPITFSPDTVDEFRRFAPHVVLHMLLLGELDARETVNTFRGMAHRLVMISSQDVYQAFGRVNRKESGPLEALPITEDSLLREHLYPYRNESPKELGNPQAWMDNYDKILAERIVMRESELPATVLRLPMVYGPRDKLHRLFPYLKRMNDHRPTILLDEAEARWRWTRGYVENVAAAIALSVTDERASGRIYNVGEIEALPLMDWIQQARQVVGWQGRIVLVPQGRLPEPLAMGIDAAQDIVVDSSRIRSELGYTEPVPLDEALRHTIDWEQANPPEQISPAEFDYAAEDAILAQLK